MFARLEDLLLTQGIASGIVLLFFAGLLAHKGLFKWTTTGFWSWAAFAMYFCINPLASIVWNLDKYRVYLELSGGYARGLWIGIVAILGMISFFVTYLLTRPTAVRWKLESQNSRVTFSMGTIIVVFVGLAVASLVAYHSGNSSIQNQAVSTGRFTTDVTGYQYIAHYFFFVPIAVLLLSRSRGLQVLGLLLGLIYIILHMPDAWGRWSIVSMILVMSLAMTIHAQKKWPPAFFLLAVIALAAVLTVRGHTSVSSHEDLQTVIAQIPDKIGYEFTHNNTDMLSFWYIDSYIKDRITGYDLGVPFFNYAVTGFIPTRILPEKYFLIDWLEEYQPALVDQALVRTIVGSKPTLLGSFYEHAGLAGVIVLAMLTGVLFRKVDGMLTRQSPLLVKAVGIVWISSVWMVWGSQDSWALSAIGTLSIPALLLWLVAPKASKAAPVQLPALAESN